MCAWTKRVGPTTIPWLTLGLVLAGCAPERATSPGGILANHLPPPPAGTVLRVPVTDGWDSYAGTGLVQTGKVLEFYASDGAYYELGTGGSLTLTFGDVPDGGTIQSVKIRFTHAALTDLNTGLEQFVASKALWQLGGGSLAGAFVAMQSRRDVPSGWSNATWDVTKWVNTPARLNDLKLIIRNFDAGTTLLDPVDPDPTEPILLEPADVDLILDRVYVEVTYGTAPAPLAMDWKVSLLPTEGWDSKSLTTLSMSGLLGNLIVAETWDLAGTFDPATVDLITGQSVSLEFQNIPADATVSSVMIHIGTVPDVDAPDTVEIDPTEPPDPDPVAPGSALIQIGRGDLANPTVLLEYHVDLASTVLLDMTAVARLASEVNDLKVAITNTGPTALLLNQVYAEATFGPTRPPIVIDHPVTILPTNGWDEKSGQTLVEGGKLDFIKTVDGKGAEILAGSSLAIDFGNIAPDSTVKSVKLRVTSYGDVGFTPGSMLWQAGGGTRGSPMVAMEHRPGGGEASATWDVTPWFRTAARVNDLTLTIRNLDPLGKKVTVDQAYLQVTYGPTPPKSTTGFQVTLFVVDGWNSKDSSNTLLTSGGTGVVNAADGQRQAIEGGRLASYRFTRIPGGSTVSGARIRTRHYEDEGFASGALVFRAGGGSLTSSTILVRRWPPILGGALMEGTDDWGVGGTINTAPLVNDLKFAVKNNDLLGKKAFINRVHVVVTHKEP